MNLSRFLKRIDWTLVVPAILLTVFGLISLYSSSLALEDFVNFQKQLAFFAVSIILVILFSCLDLRFLRLNSYLVLTLYFLSLLSLLGLFFLGTEIRGVKGWYRLGPFSLDPVPLAAIILIIVLSKYFSTRHVEIKRFQPIIASGLYTLLPFLLVLLQPDLGSSLLLVAVWLGVIIFSGIKLKHFLILTLLFLVIFCLGWKFWLKDYQRQRILSFLNPQIDKKGVSWSVNQARIAIGSGGFWGQGIGQGSQTQYGFLTEPQTDFIFAAIAEEIGFLGSFLLFGAFLFLFWRVIKIAFRAQNNFSRLFATGFASLLLAQSFINIGMCLGLLPVIGIPLPFVSYGGSQLLAFYIGLGVLMSLERKEG